MVVIIAVMRKYQVLRLVIGVTIADASGLAHVTRRIAKDVLIIYLKKPQVIILKHLNLAVVVSI